MFAHLLSKCMRRNRINSDGRYRECMSLGQCRGQGQFLGLLVACDIIACDIAARVATGDEYMSGKLRNATDPETG